MTSHLERVVGVWPTLFGALGLLCGGCAGSFSGAACEAGEVQACLCADGQPSLQRCAPEHVFGPCACAGEPAVDSGGEPSADVDPVAADAGDDDAGVQEPQDDAAVDSCAPVAGGWTAWSCGACSAECGGGTRQCTRSCTAPAPACGGAGCSGSAGKSEPCNSEPCVPAFKWDHVSNSQCGYSIESRWLCSGSWERNYVVPNEPPAECEPTGLRLTAFHCHSGACDYAMTHWLERDGAIFQGPVQSTWATCPTTLVTWTW